MDFVYSPDEDVNSGKPWSRTDDDDLRIEIEAGQSIDDAASFLCRSISEVMKRAAELGLRWSSG